MKNREEGESSSNNKEHRKNDILTQPNPFASSMILWQKYSPMALSQMYNEYISYTTKMTELYKEYVKSSERSTTLYKELAANAEKMTELYKESAESTERMTKYWLEYFWKPLSAKEQQEKEEEKIK